MPGSFAPLRMTVVSTDHYQRSVGFGEEIHRHPGSYQDYEIAYPRLGQLLRVVRSKISAYQRSNNHHETLRPADRALGNKYKHSDTINGHPQDALQGGHRI